HNLRSTSIRGNRVTSRHETATQRLASPADEPILRSAAELRPVTMAELDPRTAPSADPLIGRVVSDRYRIVRKLGEGGVGSVYFAEHLLVNRKVALKVLLPDISKPKMIDLFLDEARTVARIGHENVIDIFYGGRSPDGFVFLAMEYLEGIDLA